MRGLLHFGAKHDFSVPLKWHRLTCSPLHPSGLTRRLAPALPALPGGSAVAFIGLKTAPNWIEKGRRELLVLWNKQGIGRKALILLTNIYHIPIEEIQ